MVLFKKIRTEKDLHVNTDYKILYEDEYFLAIDKPAPLPVYAVGRFREKNLLSLLRKDLKPSEEGFRIVNRLDSETSGIVLVSKSSRTAGKLGRQFESRNVYKEYQAVVLGCPENKKGTISAPLGRQSDRGHNIRVHDPKGQPAQTDYEVLKTGKEYSLLKIVPQTGRTHQIRAHLAFLGHPIAGDKIYINPKVFERYIHEGWREDMRSIVKAERLLLHASKLEFKHPETRENIKFESEPPQFFDSFFGLENKREKNH